MANPAKNSAGLTGKQERAAQHYVAHDDMSAAYRHAYSTANMKPTTVHRSASALFSKANVAARVQELRDQTAQASTLTRERALQILAEIAENRTPGRKIRSSDKIRAVERVAKMCGWDQQGAAPTEGVSIILNIGEADDE